MNQRRLWSDALVVAERRAAAEEALGREMELPGHEYTEAEKMAASVHLERVKNGGARLASVANEDAA